jgi:mono/diheme cytochrome c family protein
MKGTIFAAVLLLVIAGMTHVETQGSAAPSAQASALKTGSDTQAVMDRYCVTCHNARMRTGGLALDALKVADAGRTPETWEKVVRKVRTGMMPPSGAPRPERAALDRFAAVVEDAIDRTAVAAPNPGAPALHRLNRTEYGNAVRDLLDLPIDSAALLPGDDSSEGFDNLASTLNVSPALMQAYVTAAAKISRLAVGDPTISADLTTYLAPRGMSQAQQREGMPFGTRGGIVVQHVFPLDAEYEFRVGRAGGGLFGLAPVGTDDSVEITLNGERVRVLGRDARGPVRFKIPAGPQTIGVAIVRRANARGVDDLFSELASAAGVTSLGINGPLNPTGPGDTPSRRRIFTCHPATAAQEVPCARTILSKLATRALRRPVGQNDAAVDTLMPFFESGRALRGFDSGVQYALARLLVDPQFIYRFERAPAGVRAGAVYRINDLELASRLSFFLWSSLPDEELLKVAAAGRLHDPAMLEQQTRRMLGDDRARALVGNLAGQWLLLRQLDDIAPGTKEFDGNLRYAFRRETELLFETIVREDRSILDLIDADYTFVDERLARHYGIPNIRGSRFRRVTLDESTRGGLLGHGSLLTVTSAGNRTSPVKRGKWILENLLGAPVPQPPPGVETNLAESTAPGATPTSVRQRLERHRANPSCASCHAVMDPVGFSLEHFDLIGKWRDADGGVPVNATGRLADGTALDGPASLRKALLDRRDAVAATATEKLLTYALGRRVEYFDMPAVRAVVRDASRSDYRFASLVTGIVKSTPFQMKRYEGGTEP